MARIFSFSFFSFSFFFSSFSFSCVFASPTTKYTGVTTAPFTASTAQVWETQNLRGRMFSVMPGAAVRFHSAVLPEVTGITLCLRGLTDKKWMIDDRLQLMFGERNAFYITASSSSEYQLQVAGSYPYVTFNVNSMVAVREVSSVWKSRCVTWDSDSGMAQLWFDGRMSVRKGVSRGAVFSGQAELSLHQFEGQLSDVYLWDSVLSTRELYRYLYQLSVPWGGKVLDWTQMEFITSGYVVLEPAYSSRFLAGPAKRNKQKRMKKRQRQEV
ncbi:serum amyloid P-component-like [Clarias gariepinus]|uniref:serum amyloid P-component-like n=1 Tax=Clarias gariepinus TaxID=13013 RepID=UPI00234D6DB3|nr:serum amyloid P-component-like [Clarias gariepinus]